MKNWRLREAEVADIPELETLIRRSAFELLKDIYTNDQIAAALGPIFGVDKQLIEDRTYYVSVCEGRIVGCGGWSFRKSHYGGSDVRSEPDPQLDPRNDPARIRAFFVDPAFARIGISSAIMKECEAAVIRMGFRTAEISATLLGENLYKNFGYRTVEPMQISLKGVKGMDGVLMRKSLE